MLAHAIPCFGMKNKYLKQNYSFVLNFGNKRSRIYEIISRILRAKRHIKHNIMIFSRVETHASVLCTKVQFLKKKSVPLLSIKYMSVIILSIMQPCCKCMNIAVLYIQEFPFNYLKKTHKKFFILFLSLVQVGVNLYAHLY